MQPSKFNARTSATVVKAIGKGHSLRSAAALAGVTHPTITDWIRTRPAFARKVDKARAGLLDKCIGVVTDAVPSDPRLALKVAGILEPEVWGERSRHEVTGAEGGPVTVKIDLLWPDGTTPPSQMP